MKREQKTRSLVVLGTASAVTLGTAIVGDPEPQGFYRLGLSDR